MANLFLLHWRKTDNPPSHHSSPLPDTITSLTDEARRRVLVIFLRDGYPLHKTKNLKFIESPCRVIYFTYLLVAMFISVSVLYGVNRIIQYLYDFPCFMASIESYNIYTIFTACRHKKVRCDWVADNVAFSELVDTVTGWQRECFGLFLVLRWADYVQPWIEHFQMCISRASDWQRKALYDGIVDVRTILYA